MPPRILIVEDNALVVGALRLLLEESGFEVDAAAGVAEAIAACQGSAPDVMLLDIRLGDGSGFDVLHALRDGSPPRVIVAVTGDDAPEIRNRCLAAGCSEVIVKPISPLELPARLRSLLASA